MGEITEAYEDQPSDNTQLAIQKGTELLGDYKYAALDENDLRVKGIIDQNTSFNEFVLDQLAINTSIQDEAFESLSYDIPPPEDIDVIQRLQEKPLFTQEEENIIRRGSFGQKKELISEMEQYPELRELSRRIIDSAGRIEEDGDQSFDPDLIRGTLDILEKLMQSPSGVVRVDGKQYFALHMPPEMSGLLGMLMGGMFRNINNYLVVSDADKSHALSQYLFSQPNLVRYFLGEHIENVQSEKIRELRQQFAKAAIDKHAAITEQVKATNEPVQTHLFDLLKKDTEHKGKITLIDLFRDDADIAAMKNEGPAKLDRVGNESGAETYVIEGGEEDALKITLASQEDAFDYTGHSNPRRKWMSHPIEEETQVRVDPESKQLEFGTLLGDQTMDWQPGDRLSDHRYKVADLFRRMQVLTVDQRLAHGMKSVPEAEKNIQQLLNTQNSSDFFQLVREMQIGNYPRHEYFVNSNPNFNIVTDVVAPQLTDEEAKKN